MKANRSLFSQLKQQYQILQMRAAYIAAEQYIIKNSETGMADAIHAAGGEQDIFTFVMDEFGNGKQLTLKEVQIQKLEDQLAELEKTGQKLLEEEKYELMQEAKEIYDIISSQLAKLRGDN